MNSLIERPQVGTTESSVQKADRGQAGFKDPNDPLSEGSEAELFDYEELARPIEDRLSWLRGESEALRAESQALEQALRIIKRAAHGVGTRSRRPLRGLSGRLTSEEKALLLRQLNGSSGQKLRGLDEALPFPERRAQGQSGDLGVFICYNSNDIVEVTEIVRMLMRRGIRTWFDPEQMRPGDQVVQVLNEVLAGVRTAAVFIGDRGLGRWQGLEQEALIAQLVQRNCRIIPVILASATQEPAIPPLLANNLKLDMRSASGDPISRLCWGITGKRLDAEEDETPGRLVY